VFSLFVEVMGRYSNHPEQGKRLHRLLQIVPDQAQTPKARTVKQVHRRLRPDIIHDLVAGYEVEGLTVRELADQFEIGRNTVSKILNREGVTIRHRSLAASQTETAAQLYRSGLSLAKVANQLGTSRGALNNAFLRAGIALRPRKGWNYPSNPSAYATQAQNQGAFQKPDDGVQATKPEAQ
jgi:lambda repressor-like predicted transcriptional regulator